MFITNVILLKNFLKWDEMNQARKQRNKSEDTHEINQEISTTW